MLSELTIRDRPNHASFLFWQEGAGYDRNIRKESTLRKVIDYIHSESGSARIGGRDGKVVMIKLACVRSGDGECTDAAESERVVLSSRRGLSTGGQATSGTHANHIPS